MHAWMSIAQAIWVSSGRSVGLNTTTGNLPGIFRVPMQPAEHLQAVHHGHLQVEQKQRGERMCVAVRKVPFARQVSNGLRPVPNDMQRVERLVSSNARRIKSTSLGLSSANKIGLSFAMLNQVIRIAHKYLKRKVQAGKWNRFAQTHSCRREAVRIQTGPATI